MPENTKPRQGGRDTESGADWLDAPRRRRESAGRRFRRVAAISALVLAAVGAADASAQAAVSRAPRVAVLSPENRSGDPRYDYIGGIIYALAMYDLSSSGSVELVDRRSIEAILEERELSLSAIAEPGSAVLGGITAADWILAGEYVLLGSELRLTLKLVEVSSSKVLSFSESGATENLVHGLVESAVERLTGKRPRLAEEGRSRSILSLRDETPGVIALFSPLVDAEVTLDGQFVGYTTGDRRVPFVIEGVEPGPHEISTDLGRDFGVVKLPEITFGPWKELVRVQSGKRLVVTDKSAHHNSTLYELKRLVRESPKVAFDAQGQWSASYSFSFVDRTGTARSGGIVVSLTATGLGAGTGTAAFQYEGLTKAETFEYAEGKDAVLKAELGLASFGIELESAYGRIDLDIEVERSDVDQGIHREVR